jgi:transcriptional regulator with XRE-family HTH domain
MEVKSMPKRKWESTGFGPQLRTAREAAGKSQRALADEVGIDVVTVSRLERGEQEPAWPLVLTLCKALGVTCEAFALAPAERPAAEEPKMGRPRKLPVADASDKPAAKKAKK